MTTNKCELAIDIGRKSWAIALRTEEGEYRLYSKELGHDFRDALKEIYANYTPTISYVEKQQTFPTDARKSAFEHGGIYYSILNILYWNNTPTQLITFQSWKKHMGLNIAKLQGESTAQKRKRGKALSVEKCKMLFPYVDISYKTARLTKESDNMAEALLIMYYARGSV